MEKIGIIGIGKLGLCFALNLEVSGYDIIGVDVNPDYINSINTKTLTSVEPQVEQMLANSTNFKASDNISAILTEDIKMIFVFVATPSLEDGSYDHAQIERIAAQLKEFGKRAKTTELVIGCTTMPGYCDQLKAQMLSFNYAVSYNPEFIAQGSIIYNQQYPDQVLIGEANEASGNAIQKVYEKLCKNEPTYCRMDPLSAEICKIATNCFLTTKISFANSIGDLATKVGADREKILKAIGSDSRIGAKYLNYGFGFGGPCFPRDNRALGKFAKESGYPLLISEATDKVNNEHFEFQLLEYLVKYNDEETILFEGVSYKKGSSLLDESQQLKLALRLVKHGRKVEIKDTKAVVDQIQSLYPNRFVLKIVE